MKVYLVKAHIQSPTGGPAVSTTLKAYASKEFALKYKDKMKKTKDAFWDTAKHDWALACKLYNSGREIASDITIEELDVV